MHKTASFAAGLMMVCNAGAQSYSVWLPEPKELVVTPGYVFQTFDEFWRGRDKVELRDRATQHKALLGLEYGLSEKLAVDLAGGYLWRRIEGRSDEGVSDTTFGARYRWIDEETIILPFVPSVGVRVGGIIEGTYNENIPLGDGDGASGAEASLLLGKAVGENFGWFGDIGYRYRNHDVPDEIFGAAGAFGSYKFLTAHLGYRHVQSLSGGNIGEVAAPEAREINQTLEAGIGFTDPGKRYYEVFYGHALSGRNMGVKDIFGVAVSFAF
jgi:hypothetical protein